MIKDGGTMKEILEEYKVDLQYVEDDIPTQSADWNMIPKAQSIG